VITYFESWKFSEFVLDDGAGVITEWIHLLDDEVRAAIDIRLLQWSKMDKWIDAYTKNFEDLSDIKEISVQCGGAVYRILGSSISIWEFVMLVGDVDARRRGKTPPKTKQIAQERLNVLRANPERRREYEI
jgi:hypothetical protein